MNKLQSIFAGLAILVSLSGCIDSKNEASDTKKEVAVKPTVDADGVPLIDLNGRIVVREFGKEFVQREVKRYVNVFGEEMSLGAFDLKYCLNKAVKSKRCDAIGEQVKKDFMKRSSGGLDPRPFDKK